MKYLFALGFSLSSMFICIILGQSWTKDYCSPNLCSGLPHIACKDTADYYISQCVKDTATIDVKPYIDVILNRYNYHRNRLAAGEIRAFNPAVRMMTMVWDEELAYLADMNAQRCDFENDECRNTDRYPISGQSLAYRWDPTDIVPEPKEALIWAIDQWFNEHVYSNIMQIKRYYIGHGTENFALMSAENNNATGCGAVSYTEGQGMTFYLVCNYGMAPVPNQPVYTAGEPTSNCRKGRNKRFSSLCSVRESDVIV